MKTLENGQGQVAEGDQYKRLSASGLVKTGAGNIYGIFVAAASTTPTIQINDDTDGSTTVLVGSFTPSAGTFYRVPSRFGAGLYITIGGTVDCTVFYS